MKRRTFLALTTALGLWPMTALAQDKLPVFASFSILGDMVATVGGDRVAVTTLVGPDGDAHVYAPTPADARTLAAAQVVIVNGLGFEGWLDRLIAASEYQGVLVVATDGVAALDIPDDDHAAGDTQGGSDDPDHAAVDPHAWQSIENAKIYVSNIEAALIAADPAGAADYSANAAEYLAALTTLDADIQAAIAALPQTRRAVVTSHDAFGYFAAAYGMTFHASAGPSTESEASAADVAALITQIKADAIPAAFVENITDSRFLEQITSETGAKVGGTLFSDALSGPGGPADTYLNMMRHNVTTLTAALGE